MQEPIPIITAEIVREAIRGAMIVNDRWLFARHNGKVPQECIDAARLVQGDDDQFQHLVWKRLETSPLVNKYFGGLIRRRLRQRGVLASPIISLIFNNPQILEHRLNNIQSVAGIESFKSEYRGSSDWSRGDITDSAMRDLLAEILTLNFLVELGFTNICKITRKREAHVDIAAKKGGRTYAIDVTRKREVHCWELESAGGVENCQSKRNQLEIRRRILQALDDKNEQFCRALRAGTISDSSVKVVAIKSSDHGFAECIEQAVVITQELLSDGNRWEGVDCVWLIPNVELEQSRWVFKPGMS